MIKCMLFTASWCGPCKRIKPLFANLPNEIDDVEFSVKDIEADADLAKHYGVRSIPTMVITKNEGVQNVVINPATYEQMKQAVLSHSSI